MKKQGYADRMDESMGMKMKNEMGHASKVMKIDAAKAQYEENKGLVNQPIGNRGQPKQAWDYKF